MYFTFLVAVNVFNLPYIFLTFIQSISTPFLLANAFFSITEFVASLFAVHFIQQFEIYVKFSANKFSTQTMKPFAISRIQEDSKREKEKKKHTHNTTITIIEPMEMHETSWMVLKRLSSCHEQKQRF